MIFALSYIIIFIRPVHNDCIEAAMEDTVCPFVVLVLIKLVKESCPSLASVVEADPSLLGTEL